jgi:hypothetical protein
MPNGQQYEKLLINIANQEQFYKMLLEQYEWAEEYLYYYIYIVYARRESVSQVLESISLADRSDYSPQKAYNYLKEYEKTNLNFAVIIPTCNRPEAIEYILNYAAILYRRYGIDIIIYDSSDNDNTRKIVNKMRANGYYNVLYSEYNGIFDGFSLDHKIISAYNEFKADYEYIWICRDGLVPIIDEIIDRLRIFSKKKIDCIIVDTLSRNHGVEIEKYYTSLSDCEDFLVDQASRLQTLGMLIMSNRLIDKLINQEPISEKNYSLWQMASPFHLFAREPFGIVFLTKNVFALNEKASSTHFWSKAEKALEQWGYRWYTVIMNMPEVYDNVKAECLMIYTIDFHPFTPREIIRMRGWGGLTIKMVNKYKKYIDKVTMTPIGIFYLATIMPKIVARLSYKCILKKPNLSKKIRTNFFRYNTVK